MRLPGRRVWVYAGLAVVVGTIALVLRGGAGPSGTARVVPDGQALGITSSPAPTTPATTSTTVLAATTAATVPPSTAPGSTARVGDPRATGVCQRRGPDGGVPAGTFPGAACTGVPPGTRLQPLGGNLDVNGDGSADMYRIDLDGTVLDGVDISVPLCVFASDVTVRRSRIQEAVYAAGPAQQGACSGNRPEGYVARNYRFEDVEIVGAPARVAAFTSLHGNGLVCVRCHVRGASAGFYGSNMTIVDSYVHDLFGDTDSHNEAVLGFGGSIVIRRSNLVGILSPASTGGAVSAALALYSHGDWGPLAHVVVEGSRLETSTGVFCAYGGDSGEQDPVDIRFVGNTFVRNADSGTCGGGGPITGWRPGGGNVWADNRFDDGELVPEPS